MFRQNLLCLLPFFLAVGSTEKSLGPSLHPAFTYLYILMRFPFKPSLLQTEQFQLSQPFLVGGMLQSLNHLSGPSLDLLQLLRISFVLGSPELDPAFQVWPHRC